MYDAVGTLPQPTNKIESSPFSNSEDPIAALDAVQNEVFATTLAIGLAIEIAAENTTKDMDYSRQAERLKIYSEQLLRALYPREYGDIFSHTDDEADKKRATFMKETSVGFLAAARDLRLEDYEDKAVLDNARAATRIFNAMSSLFPEPQQQVNIQQLLESIIFKRFTREDMRSIPFVKDATAIYLFEAEKAAIALELFIQLTTPESAILTAAEKANLKELFYHLRPVEPIPQDEKVNPDDSHLGSVHEVATWALNKINWQAASLRLYDSIPNTTPDKEIAYAIQQATNDEDLDMDYTFLLDRNTVTLEKAVDSFSTQNESIWLALTTLQSILANYGSGNPEIERYVQQIVQVLDIPEIVKDRKTTDRIGAVAAVIQKTLHTTDTIAYSTDSNLPEAMAIIVNTLPLLAPWGIHTQLAMQLGEQTRADIRSEGTDSYASSLRVMKNFMLRYWELVKTQPLDSHNILLVELLKIYNGRFTNVNRQDIVEIDTNIARSTQNLSPESLNLIGILSAFDIVLMHQADLAQRQHPYRRYTVASDSTLT